MRAPRVPFRLALAAAIGLSLVVGLVPAGVALDRLLAERLEDEAREDLTMAPKLVAEQDAAVSDAMMMRAKELAQRPDLREAYRIGDRDSARATLFDAPPLYDRPVLTGPAGESWLGPTGIDDLVEATRGGEMPVKVVADSTGLTRVALAPVMEGERWLGAAGWASRLDRAYAERLAGLTRSDVTIVGADGRVAVSTLSEETTRELADAARGSGSIGVERVFEEDRRWLVSRAPLSTGATLLFSRDLETVLSALPGMRRAALVAALVAIVLALGLGVALTAMTTRPVRSLAEAARRLETGDFDAPVPASSIREIDRLGTAFARMRRALSERLRELREANAELAERKDRLTALQAELIQRDRLAASARLVAELAHEIRNPVASLKNCLEIVRRRVDDDPKAAEFADLALEELLRMHELAEQMLDLHRPRRDERAACDPAEVAREVAALLGVDEGSGTMEIEVRGSGRARIPADALKQILFNLLQNTREARPEGARVEIEVERVEGIVGIDVVDNGPGVDEAIVERIFDPFFTTKGSVHGTGLGLYVAEGLVRRYGGRITAENRKSGGLRVRLEFEAASAQDTETERRRVEAGVS
ncbi:MAG: HAMP domain-containing sensor histidine kinase [Gemmatimonadota bacterium]|nr:HAMP domain-containing sensor histidine kinase [Gemmatimonadota bacterium]